MSFTIPPSPNRAASKADEENRAKLFASSVPKAEKSEEQRKDEMIATLMVQLQESLNERERMSESLAERREIEIERGELLEGMAKTIERQNAIILQQQRTIQQPTGFKWLISAVAGLALECFFFLDRLMKLAAKNIKSLASHVWTWILARCETMVRYLHILEERLEQSRRYIQRFRSHRAVRA